MQGMPWTRSERPSLLEAFSEPGLAGASFQSAHLQSFVLAALTWETHPQLTSSLHCLWDTLFYFTLTATAFR